MRMNHCSEISGSMRSPERWEYGHLVRVGLAGRREPLSLEPCDDRLAAPPSTVSPAKRSPASAVIRPSSPITALLEAVAVADLEVVGVVAGVIFSAPVPKSDFT